MVIKFLRRDAKRFSKFGKGKGKKATYRKPTGRDNKMREKRKGYAPVVSIGYGTKKVESNVVKILNLNDLKKVSKDQIGLVEKVGEKKKIEIVKKAKEMKIALKNINVDSFLKKLNKNEKMKKSLGVSKKSEDKK